MSTATRRDVLLEILRNAGDRGMSCDEMGKLTGMTVGQLSACLAQAADAGFVHRLSGKRRNDAGRSVLVWAANTTVNQPTRTKIVKLSPGKRREKVLNALRAAGSKGMTCDELSEHVGIGPHILPSYLNRFAQGGFVHALRIKRKNKAGRTTTVWAISDVPEVTAESRPNDFWMDIRKRVAEYVKSKSDNVSEMVFEQVFRDFEIDMRDLVKSFQNRLDRRQQPVLAAVSRKAVFSACRTLQIEPPKMGEMVNETAAKRNKREMVRTYHPDAAKVSNDATREMYEAVIDAYDTIMQYNDSLRSQKNVP